LERALYLTKSAILTYPRGPTSPGDLAIPDEWAIHPDETDFVVGDFMLARTRAIKAERIIILSHPRNLRILSQCEVAAGDGTFEMRFPPQKEWKQLYIIHGLVKNIFVPLVGFASNSTTARMYVSAITYLKDYMRESLELEWKPRNFLSDFEAAVISALPRVFTHPGFTHKGCWFHHSQAIVRRLKSLKLLNHYEKDELLKQYIDKLRYIALVPFFSIGQTLQLLTDRRRPDVSALFRKYPALKVLVFEYYIPVGFTGLT